MPSVELMTDNIAQPALFARCDSHCPNFFAMPWDAALDASANLRRFVDGAADKGFAVGLLGNMCAAHVAKAREGQPQIIAPASWWIQ